jgi:hypothetical protein
MNTNNHDSRRASKRRLRRLKSKHASHEYRKPFTQTKSVNPNRKRTPMNTQTQTEDRLKLKCALLDLVKPNYENIRADLIERLGYDQFREIQNDIFKEIGTIEFEKRFPATLQPISAS